MGRYVERSGGTTYTWKYRTPIVINNSGGSPTPEDATFVVPTNWDHFWSTLGQADGDDIRLTAADGETALTWQFNPALNVGNRAATFEIDAAVNATSSFPGAVLWLYWGNASVSSGAGSFAYAASKTAYVLTSSYAHDVRFVWDREPINVNRARPSMQKAADEVLVVAIAYRGVLARRGYSYGGGGEDEEPAYFNYAVYDDTSAQAAMIDATAIRADEDYVYVIVKAGTNGTEYTGRVTMTTTSKSNTGLARTLIFSFTIRVKNPTEG